MSGPRRRTKPFAVCVGNRGNEAALILGKLYRVRSGTRAAKDGLLRVVDESGEDYLFPSDTSGIDWTAMRDALASLLRARPGTETDSTRSHLTVSRVRSADSLEFDFSIGHYRRCANRKDWQGSHTNYRFAVAWDRLTWPYQAQAREHGDIAPCPERGTP